MTRDHAIGFLLGLAIGVVSGFGIGTALVILSPPVDLCREAAP